MLRVLISLGLVTLSGCAAARAECRVHGGVDWYAAKTHHFRLRTNVSASEAVDTANALEQLRPALWRYFGVATPAPSHQVDVVLLADVQQIIEFDERNAGWTDASAANPVIHVTKLRASNVTSRGPLAHVAHELGHLYARVAWATIPKWVDEGVAEYLESAALLDATTVQLGMVQTANLDVIHTLGVVPLDELWKWGDGEADVDRRAYYASAWLWVHFLSNRYPAQLWTFYGALARGEEARGAFNAAFAAMDPKKLYEEANAYRLAADYKTLLIESSPQSDVRSAEPLDAAAIHVIRSELARTAGKAALAKKEWGIARSLARPGSFSDLIIRLTDGTGQLDATHELVQRFGDEEAAWTAYAEATNDGDEGRAAIIAEGLKAFPRNATLQDAAGREALLVNAPELAHAHFNKALAVAPWVPSTWLRAAIAAARRGQCAEAADAYQRARSLRYAHQRQAMPEAMSCEELAGARF